MMEERNPTRESYFVSSYAMNTPNKQVCSGKYETVRPSPEKLPASNKCWTHLRVYNGVQILTGFSL